MKKFILLLAFCLHANAATNAVSGVYLPDIYIDELKKSKSHTLALNKFISTTNATKADAILINNYKITYVYGYSDAETKNITVLETKTITIMNPNGTLYDIKREKGRIEDDSGTRYSQVGHIKDVILAAQFFITKTIFGKKRYRSKNGEELFLDDHGRLYYKNMRYEFLLSRQNDSNYDTIYSKNENKTYFLGVKNKKIHMYQSLNKDNEPEYFATEFILVDELE
ncbi:MAG: hypothetical protein LBL65_04355 [Campylobacteraceae bacterium]|jgi:hypothetical protein|nr:hypothetical protein [Campylobacteraceae bacterium]